MREKRSCGGASPVTSPRICRDNRRVAGGHSAPQLTEGVHTYRQNSERKIRWARPQNSAPGHSRGPISRPGIASFQGHSRSAGPRGQGEVGGKLHIRGAADAERPVGLQSSLHIPGELENCRLDSRAEVVRRGFGVPGATLRAKTHLRGPPRNGSHPTRQLADFRKAPAGGGAAEERAAPSRPGGGSRPHPGPAAPGRTSRSRERTGAPGARRSAVDPQEGGAGRAARRGSGAVGATAIPPPPWQQCGGRARLPGWRAAEVPRSWSGAGAAAASRRRAAAAAGRTGGRAELGGGAARPAGRGGADRPR